MKLILISILLILNVFTLGAQTVKPLYQLPDKSSLIDNSQVDSSILSNFLVGSDEGLYRITSNNSSIPVWTEARVDQIITASLPDSTGVDKPCVIMRTSKGIYVSFDLKTFESRNEGLAFLTVKKYKNHVTTLEKQIQELKDLCVNPLNNSELVTATKDNVYYSSNGGITWKNLRSMSLNTPGLKAVGIATIEDETVVFMSHPIFGLSYICPNKQKPVWTDIESGFEKMKSLTSTDEISDILSVVRTNAGGDKYTEVYISQMYMPRIYKLTWENKNGQFSFAGKLIYSGTEPAAAIDGLTTIDDVLLYTTLEGFGSIDINLLISPGSPAKYSEWQKAFASTPGMTNSAWIPQSRSGFSKGILVNELWMLFPGTVNSPYAEKANGKKSIYASAYQCSFPDGVEKFKKIVKDREMNSIVIDMKDDYGYLRYISNDPLVKEKGATSSYAIKDLEGFIKEFKQENIYLVARIVTFKDRSLTKYAGGKYAVWDGKNNKPWVGIKGYEETKDEEGNVTGKNTLYYDENWVDPYSEEVWEYNIAVAKELINRGFDEIQFDYIRFPTDGYNLRDARYRWQNKGMDKESALISFLSYARENINAPIGIDIYGANGWYRCGTRTGQDAEMLAQYVDVIGPMFYPSHFEDSFLNYEPKADRTYRIYYYGSFRNTILCRNRAIIRPWIQCFYLGYAPYDRLFYDSDYIKKEFFGVRDSIDRGYMCWNNSGDYSVTPPDVSATEVFNGQAYEASAEFKKPAIGTVIKPLVTINADISVLDSIRLQYDDPANRRAYIPFLQITPPGEPKR